jgi:hypothetical protein
MRSEITELDTEGRGAHGAKFLVGMLGLVLSMLFAASAQASVTADFNVTDKHQDADGTWSVTLQSTSTDTSDPSGQNLPAKEEWDPDYNLDNGFQPQQEGRTVTFSHLSGGMSGKYYNMTIRVTGHDGTVSHPTSRDVLVPGNHDAPYQPVYTGPTQFVAGQTDATFAVSTTKMHTIVHCTVAAQTCDLKVLGQSFDSQSKLYTTAYRLLAAPVGDGALEITTFSNDPANPDHGSVNITVTQHLSLFDLTFAPKVKRHGRAVRVKPGLTFMAPYGSRSNVVVRVYAKASGHYRQICTTGGTDRVRGATTSRLTVPPLTCRLPAKYQKAKHLLVRVRGLVASLESPPTVRTFRQALRVTA